MRHGSSGTIGDLLVRRDKRFALIIASYEYDDARLKRLVAPAQDAEALAAVLGKPSIGDFQVRVLVNRDCDELRREVQRFFAKRQRDDTLLLYFSGHGVKNADGELYFATKDTDRDMLESTAVPASFVNKMMQQSLSRAQILLLDCCYAGAFAKGMTVRADQEVGTGEYFRDGRGWGIMTASDTMQYAFEGEDMRGNGVRSLFTSTLVEGLGSGEADMDGDQEVSFNDAYEYVKARVAEATSDQKPMKWVFRPEGEIFLAHCPNPVAKPLPPDLRQAIGSPLSEVREGAARALAGMLGSTETGVAAAAREGLERLAKDASPAVVRAARRTLAEAPAAPLEARELFLGWLLLNAGPLAVAGPLLHGLFELLGPQLISISAGGSWLSPGSESGSLVGSVVVCIMLYHALGAALMGPLLALAQLVVLRRFVPSTRLWIVATTIGCVLPPAGAFVGVAQWLVLRGRVPGAGRWALHSLYGWLAWVCLLVAIRPEFDVGRYGTTALVCLAWGCANGAATGIMVVRWLRKPSPQK